MYTLDLYAGGGGVDQSTHLSTEALSLKDLWLQQKLDTTQAAQEFKAFSKFVLHLKQLTFSVVVFLGGGVRKHSLTYEGYKMFTIPLGGRPILIEEHPL